MIGRYHKQHTATYTYTDADGRPVFYRDRFEWMENGELEKLETEARDAKKGLWADSQPVPPWVYRKGNR